MAAAGRTRTCPHCKATILESAAVCPACNHHLRFGAAPPGEQPRHGEVAFAVEGSVQHPLAGEPWEYSVVVVVRNQRGEEIARKVVDVGALGAGDACSFGLTVELFKPGSG